LHTFLVSGSAGGGHPNGGAARWIDRSVTEAFRIDVIEGMLGTTLTFEGL
jgi:hypothetical protein